jgi:hypothetical protein
MWVCGGYVQFTLLAQENTAFLPTSPYSAKETLLLSWLSWRPARLGAAVSHFFGAHLLAGAADWTLMRT